MKRPSAKASPTDGALGPVNTGKIALAKFPMDLSAAEVKTLLVPGLDFPYFQFPIETLSPAKTVGKGRTNLTIIMPTIVQLDTATPYARFDRQATPVRNPIIQMHFEPKAYGITSASTYHMVFRVETTGPVTFSAQGFAGSGTLANPGSRTVNGQMSLSLIFRNVPASQVIYGYLEQTGGSAWAWYSVEVRFPAIVIKA